MARPSRLNHHCHGPGQFELYGYRNWTACYEAVANRLSRLGSRELGHIERKAKRAYIQMFKASLWLASSTRNSKHKLLYAPTMDASAGSWETSLDDGRQIGDNRGRHLTVFGAPREVVHGVEKGAKTLTISQAHRCIGGYYLDGQDSNAVMLRFTNAGKHQFGPTSGNGDYRINGRIWRCRKLSIRFMANQTAQHTIHSNSDSATAPRCALISDIIRELSSLTSSERSHLNEV